MSKNFDVVCQTGTEACLAQDIMKYFPEDRRQESVVTLRQLCQMMFLQGGLEALRRAREEANANDWLVDRVCGLFVRVTMGS